MEWNELSSMYGKEFSGMHREQDRSIFPDSVVDEWTNTALLDYPVHCAYRTTSLFQPAFHSHSGYEFYLCLQGKGMFVASDGIHGIGAGTFTVVRPRAVHLPKPNMDVSFHRYILAIQGSYLEKLYAEDKDCSSLIGQWLPDSNKDSAHFILNGGQLLYLQEIMAKLERELQIRQRFFPLIVKSLLLQLFAQLGRYQIESRVEQKGNDEQRQLVERIRSYIMEHYNEPLRMDDLCDQFHLSRSYLFRIFKGNTGASVNDYLITYRISKAKDFLQGTELPITEIAANAGFQDVSHFCNTFKRLSGMTPSRYRSLHD